jgi:hypothetical protein
LLHLGEEGRDDFVVFDRCHPPGEVGAPSLDLGDPPVHGFDVRRDPILTPEFCHLPGEDLGFGEDVLDLRPYGVVDDASEDPVRRAAVSIPVGLRTAVVDRPVVPEDVHGSVAVPPEHVAAP